MKQFQVHKSYYISKKFLYCLTICTVNNREYQWAQYFLFYNIGAKFNLFLFKQDYGLLSISFVSIAMTNTFFITPLSTSSHLWVLVSFNAAKCGQILSDAEAKSFGDLKKINSQWEITPKLKWNNSDIAFKITSVFNHCRQRAPVGIVLSSSGTSQLGMFDIQATTKSKYYDHLVLLYLESWRCRYRSIIFACFYLYITVVIFIDYSDIDKMMDINNEKC